MKSDESIRNVCIASIKRNTILPYDFKLTRFWESEQWDEISVKLPELMKVSDGELPIAMVTVSANEFTIVTTSQIISSQDGVLESINPGNVTSWQWSDFKGYTDKSFTRGWLTLIGEQIFEIFIETGKASMVTIYSIRTLVNLLKS